MNTKEACAETFKELLFREHRAVKIYESAIAFLSLEKNHLVLADKLKKIIIDERKHIKIFEALINLAARKAEL